MDEKLGPNSFLHSINRFPSRKKPHDEILRTYFSQNEYLRRLVPIHAEAWQNHFVNSRSAITKSAQNLTGDALILGVGNAMDIPLTELTEQFDTVTLVDLDEASVKYAVNQLSPFQQQKCRVIIDDLTGAVQNVYSQLSTISEEETTSHDFIREAVHVIPTIPSEPLIFGQRYDFVTSSLILSQLPSLVVDHLDSRARLKYSKTPPPIPDDQLRLQIALTQLAMRLQSEHIDLLSRATASTGKVYLSDTVTRIMLQRMPNTQQIMTASDHLPMVNGQLLSQKIEEHFTAESFEPWVWYRKPPERALVTPTRGDAFQVMAFTLTPKPLLPE